MVEELLMALSSNENQPLLFPLNTLKIGISLEVRVQYRQHGYQS